MAEEASEMVRLESRKRAAKRREHSDLHSFNDYQVCLYPEHQNLPTATTIYYDALPVVFIVTTGPTTTTLDSHRERSHLSVRWFVDSSAARRFNIIAKREGKGELSAQVSLQLLDCHELVAVGATKH